MMFATNTDVIPTQYRRHTDSAFKALRPLFQMVLKPGGLEAGLQSRLLKECHA